MSNTYTADPANNEVDFIRFSIGDTNLDTVILTDTEIEYIISITATDTTAYRLAVAFRAAATALAAKLVKRSLGPQSEDASKRHSYYVEQAEKYEKISSFAGTPDAIVYSADLVFDKNMMGNEV